MNPLRRLSKSLGYAALDVALPSTAWLRGPCRSTGSVHLTFDDGPHPTHTKDVLSALARHGARATFFVVGERVAAYPDLARQILEEGHALGHHSYAHLPPDSVTAAALRDELARTAALFEHALHHRARLFRPPHGKLTLGKLGAVLHRGERIVLWSSDPKDFAARRTQDTLDYFTRTPPRPGEIVLLHDVNPRTAEVVDALVPGLLRRGLRCAALSVTSR